MSNETLKNNLQLSWQICLWTLLVTAFVMVPELAMAKPVTLLVTAFVMVPELAMAKPVLGGGGGEGGSKIAKPLQTMVGWFTGDAGKAVATLGIMVVGVGALLGKVSWGMALIVGLGVTIVFGADAIMGSLK